MKNEEQARMIDSASTIDRPSPSQKGSAINWSSRFTSFLFLLRTDHTRYFFLYRCFWFISCEYKGRRVFFEIIFDHIQSKTDALEMDNAGGWIIIIGGGGYPRNMISRMTKRIFSNLYLELRFHVLLDRSHRMDRTKWYNNLHMHLLQDHISLAIFHVWCYELDSSNQTDWVNHTDTYTPTTIFDDRSLPYFRRINNNSTKNHSNRSFDHGNNRKEILFIVKECSEMNQIRSTTFPCLLGKDLHCSCAEKSERWASLSSLGWIIQIRSGKR